MQVFAEKDLTPFVVYTFCHENFHKLDKLKLHILPVLLFFIIVVSYLGPPLHFLSVYLTQSYL